MKEVQREGEERSRTGGGSEARSRVEGGKGSGKGKGGERKRVDNRKEGQREESKGC